VTVKRAATSVNPNPHETLLSVFLADIRLSVDSGTYARAFGLPTSTGSIPSRATEFTMIRSLRSPASALRYRGWALLTRTPDETISELIAHPGRITRGIAR